MRDGRSKILDLSASKTASPKFSRIPDFVFELENLEELNLRGQNIQFVPEKINDLVYLKRINLFEVPVNDLPDFNGLEIDWNTYIEFYDKISPRNIVGLNVSMGYKSQRSIEPVRHFDMMKSGLARLRNLLSLRIGPKRYLVGDPLPVIEELLEPVVESLDQLRRLRTLTFWAIGATKLPQTIRQLRDLRQLTFFGLDELPEWLVELQELRSLNLKGHSFDQIPGVIFTL